MRMPSAEYFYSASLPTREERFTRRLPWSGYWMGKLKHAPPNQASPAAGADRAGSAFHFAGHNDGNRQASRFHRQHPIIVAFFGDCRKRAAGRRLEREHGGMGSADTFDAGIH